jgi:hypothetical protein
VLESICCSVTALGEASRPTLTSAARPTPADGLAAFTLLFTTRIESFSSGRRTAATWMLLSGEEVRSSVLPFGNAALSVFTVQYGSMGLPVPWSMRPNCGLSTMLYWCRIETLYGASCE